MTIFWLSFQRIDATHPLHKARRADWFFDADGTFVIHARLSPEIGAVVRRALDAALEHTTASTNEQNSENASAETFATRHSITLRRSRHGGIGSF